MAMKESPGHTLSTTAASAAAVEELLGELRKRLMVVSEDALDHLTAKGVIARMARAACCKPDGGTCCPNRSGVVVSAARAE